MRRIKHIIGFLLSFAATAVIGLSHTACQPDGLSDNTEFALYYAGITDIGLSTPISIKPSHIGPAPSEFAITKITLDGEAINTGCFVIDAESGEFSMSGTDDMETGLYKVSISCVAGGRTWHYEDIISINLMKPIPEGIVVEPAVLNLSLSDITEPVEGVDLPTAQIVTEGEHISVTGYKIAGVRRDGTAIEDFNKLFSISSEGLFTINKGIEDFIYGTYVVDFKLTTLIVDASSEEGIFSNALEINVTAPPQSLVYSPAEADLEESTGYVSSAPQVTGSTSDAGFTFSIEEARYTTADDIVILDVNADDSFIEMNPSTGVITLSEGHGFKEGESLDFKVKVQSEYGSLVVPDALNIKFVGFIEPVANLSYSDVNIVFAQKIEQVKAAGFTGDNVKFSFVDLAPELQEYLTIDEYTGFISADKYNEIPEGEHTVKVKAVNTKNELEASFILKVDENPNWFTYIHYGNNLGLGTTEAEIVSYASQHRIDFAATKTLDLSVLSDIKDKSRLKFTYEPLSDVFYEKSGQHTLGEDGSIKFNFKGAEKYIQMLKVTAKAGDDEATSITRETVVFVHLSQTTKTGYKIEYTPFVMRFNPKTGAAKDTPELKVNGTAPKSNFGIDFRGAKDTGYYFSLNGSDAHVSGNLEVTDGFLYGRWNAYFVSINKEMNPGGRDPVSAYQRPNTTRLLYISTTGEDQYRIKVTPELWRDDNGYANGLFVFPMVFGEAPADATTLDPHKNGFTTRVYECVVWFDEKF